MPEHEPEQLTLPIVTSERGSHYISERHERTGRAGLSCARRALSSAGLTGVEASYEQLAMSSGTTETSAQTSAAHTKDIASAHQALENASRAHAKRLAARDPLLAAAKLHEEKCRTDGGYKPDDIGVRGGEEAVDAGIALLKEYDRMVA